MPNDLFILILAVAAIGFAGFIVCVWRFTGIVSRMSEYGARFSERNEAMRDRFVQQIIEKMQVGEEQGAVRMAQMHASEAAQGLKDRLQRDGAADKEARKARRAAEAQRKLRAQMAAEDPDVSVKDAFG